MCARRDVHSFVYLAASIGVQTLMEKNIIWQPYSIGGFISPESGGLRKRLGAVHTADGFPKLNACICGPFRSVKG